MSRDEREHSAMDEASRVWDAVVRGAAPDSTDLDPTLVETIRRLQLLGEQPHADPSFATQLEETLMHAITRTPLAPLSIGRMVTTVPNGRPPRGFSPHAPVEYEAPRARWALAYLATAALVLLTLIASYAVFGGALRLGHEDDDPAVIPALIGTPEASPVPGLLEDTVLFAQRIDDIPAEASWTGIERITLDAGGAMTQGAAATAGVGPTLYRVEQGTVTMQADGPVMVTRAGTTSATALEPGTAVELNVDDVVFTPADVVSQWRNAGPAAAVLLDTGIQIPGGEPPPDSGETYVQPINAWPIHPPPAPVELMVRRLTLAPGASLAGEPAPGLKLVGVDAGTLTIVSGKRTDPAVESRTILSQSSWMDINTGTTFAKELRNDSGQPLTLFVLSVVPLGGSAATPIATPPAVPS